MSSEEEAIYCICRSADVSRFMIGCDHCEEWFHGDCINVTAKDSKYIKKFYCKECREKNAHLSVVYKSKYAEVLKEREKEDRKKEKTGDKHSPKKSKEKKKNKDRDRSRSRDRHKHKDKKHKRDKDEKKHKEDKKDKEEKKDKHKEERKDKEKYKEERKEKEKEKEREERKEKFKSRAIISDDSDEDVEVVQDVVKKTEEKEKEEEKKKQKEWEKERQKLREERKKEEEKRKKEEKERKKEEKEKEKKARSLSTDSRHKSIDEPPQKKQNVVDEDSSEDEWVPTVPSPAPATSNKQKRKPLKETNFNKRKRAWRPSYASSEDEEVHDLTPRQCYGMDCVNCARVGSKYCSDQCGTNVASLRIYQTLPERLREWSMTSCMAESKNRKELERIRDDIQTTKRRLEEVDKEAEVLENTISRAKTMSIIEHKSEDSSDEDDEHEIRGGAVNCISCGKDVPTRSAIRHMETCFNKFESQTSFGSMYKTKIEGYQMFCDFFNPQTGTYCKRLRVICPEHTKDHKQLESEVCGFPLTKNVFKETGEFCRLSRKECNEHYCWEKLKRAELDMDRVRQWLKLDELLEKERQEKEAMSRRAGVLNLLLHSTFNHEVAQIIKNKNKNAQDQKNRLNTSQDHKSRSNQQQSKIQKRM